MDLTPEQRAAKVVGGYWTGHDVDALRKRYRSVVDTMATNVSSVLIDTNIAHGVLGYVFYLESLVEELRADLAAREKEQ